MGWWFLLALNLVCAVANLGFAIQGGPIWFISAAVAVGNIAAVTLCAERVV